MISCLLAMNLFVRSLIMLAVSVSRKESIQQGTMMRDNVGGRRVKKGKYSTRDNDEGQRHSTKAMLHLRVSQ